MVYDNNSKGISYSAGFFMLIAFAIAGLIFASLIGAQVWTGMTGKSIKDFSSGNFDASDSAAHKVMQVLNQVLGYFLPALVAAGMLSHQPTRLLGYTSTPRWSQAGLVILIFIVSLVFSGGLSYVNHHIPIPVDWKIKFDKWEADYISQVDKIVYMKDAGDYLLALIVMAMLPAVCEETLFRGGLQNFLIRATKKPWLSIIIVSLIFSAAHFSFYGFLYRLFLGIVLGLLFHYSGKLWLSILGHFLNNALVITIIYINNTQGVSSKEAMKNEVSGWWGLLVLPVIILLFNYYRRISAADKRAAFS
jgi:uncharacterized protein